MWRGSLLDGQTALALLQWQREMGADEAMLDGPLDRTAVQAPIAPPAPVEIATATPEPGGLFPAVARQVDNDLAQAKVLAEHAVTLEALAEAQQNFDGLELKRGARNLVFADGHPAARIMIIGEAPGEEEDACGVPFVGRAGQLLNKMLAAIGLDRSASDAGQAVYIANVVKFRPPGNRRPTADEVALSLPFLRRQIELVGPEAIVLMGNTPCLAALGRDGILRLRGQWTTAFGVSALPMTHPAYLLRNPIAKRDAWADLLSLADRMSLLT